MANQSPSKLPVIFLAFANDKEDNLAYLRNLPKELDGIRRTLQKAVQAGLCEVVERASATIENILDVFQDEYYKDRIAIFHYGGHANGYQLLLEALDGSKSVAHSSGLVPFFARQKGLKLVFLNGCSSQQQALDLIHAGIPAVIGTSQSINDEIATKLSVRFYNAIANGAPLEKSWLEAVDAVKIETGGTGRSEENFRALYRKDKQEVEHRMPWDLYVREGSEIIRTWNLPEEVDNPLFGLPEIPLSYHVPEEPYLFLRRYERQHAQVFFGRSYYIRDLYNRVHDRNTPSIILMYGQSGAGKSSLLEAGMIPRLESEYEMRYVRRMPQRGLSGTLQAALNMEPEAIKLQFSAEHNYESKIRKLQEVLNNLHESDHDVKINIQDAIDKLKAAQESRRSILKEANAQAQAHIEEMPSVLERWKQIEQEKGRPLIVILDQVEETFTNPNSALKHEFQDFLELLDSLFRDRNTAPQGKLILSYRKEFNPEIEEGFKQHTLPRTTLFLETLDHEDIVDVITGISRMPKLKAQYKLTVDPELPSIIADDLLEDKDSSVAPILQIVLTKMWRKATEVNKEAPHFTVAMYQGLRKEGLAMREFFDQQMKILASRCPDLVDCGLALDILKFHTTSLGTAYIKRREEIWQHYSHRNDVLDKLIQELKELYLLTETQFSKDSTSLTHDTLAPVIIQEYTNSHKVGQRASRILNTKLYGIDTYRKDIWLDEGDLDIVEKGKHGMRLLRDIENSLLEYSTHRKKQSEQQRVQIMQVAIAILATVVAMAFFMTWEWFKNETRKEILASYDLIDGANKAFAERDTFKTVAYAESALQLALSHCRNDSLEHAQRLGGRRSLRDHTHQVMHMHRIARDSTMVRNHFASLLNQVSSFGSKRAADKRAAISGDGKWLLVFSSDSLVVTNQLNRQRRLFCQPHPVDQVTIAADSHTALISYMDTTFARLDLLSGKFTELQIPGSRVVSAMFIPRQNTIVFYTENKQGFYLAENMTVPQLYPILMYAIEPYASGGTLIALSNVGLRVLYPDNTWGKFPISYEFSTDEKVKYQLAGWKDKLNSFAFMDPVIWSLGLGFLAIVLMNIFLELFLLRRWYLGMIVMAALLLLIAVNWIYVYPDATEEDRYLLSIIFISIPVTVGTVFVLKSLQEQKLFFIVVPILTMVLLVSAKIYHITISPIELDWLVACIKMLAIFAGNALVGLTAAYSVLNYYNKNYSRSRQLAGISLVATIVTVICFQWMF